MVVNQMKKVKEQAGLLKRIGTAIKKKFWGTGKGFKAIDDLKKAQKKKLKMMKEIEK